MADLKDLTAKARSAQKYKPSTKQSASKKPTAKNTPRKKVVKNVTANSKSRARAGVKPSGLSQAERQAQRRKELARISFELTIEEKAKLLEAAAAADETITTHIRKLLNLDK